MDPTVQLIAVALAVVLVIVVACLPRGTRGSLALSAVAVGLTAFAALQTVADPARLELDSAVRVALVLLTAVLALLGGSVVVTTAFDAIDRAEVARAEARDGVGDAGEPRSDRGSIAEAGEVLRGGAWIGCLERAWVLLSLLLAWPEGIAVVLAVKALGRYPELKTHESRGDGAAERFIIGTLISLGWAALCAYAALGAVPSPGR